MNRNASTLQCRWMLIVIHYALCSWKYFCNILALVLKMEFAISTACWPSPFALLIFAIAIISRSHNPWNTRCSSPCVKLTHCSIPFKPVFLKASNMHCALGWSTHGFNSTIAERKPWNIGFTSAGMMGESIKTWDAVANSAAPLLSNKYQKKKMWKASFLY